MRLINFSLWGDNPKYTIGAVKNAQISQEVYPGWTLRYYIADNVPIPIVDQLLQYEHVQIIHKQNQDWDSMFWRFYPMGEDVEYTLSRDTDSRLNHREKAAVDQWIESGKSFHIMRDHRWHAVPILGGMHGSKGNLFPNIQQIIKDYIRPIQGKQTSNFYQIDQNFLRDYVLPRIQNDCLRHDEIFSNDKWPTARINNEYVGAPYDENDKLLIEFVP